MSGCNHTITRGRSGLVGCWCENCGVKVLDVESRQCCECKNFSECGMNNLGACSLKSMFVTKDMLVTFKISDGSCFTEKGEL